MKLSDTQLVLLSAAASRSDGAVLPPPDTLRLGGGALSRCLCALLKRGLIAERFAVERNNRRPVDQGAGRALTITRRGLEAIGVDPVEEAVAPPPEGAALTSTSSAPPKGKLGILVTMISTEDGAALAELSEAVGWQPNTTRAALTRLRKRGFAVTLETSGQRRAYRLARAR